MIHTITRKFRWALSLLRIFDRRRHERRRDKDSGELTDILVIMTENRFRGKKARSVHGRRRAGLASAA